MKWLFIVWYLPVLLYTLPLKVLISKILSKLSEDILYFANLQVWDSPKFNSRDPASSLPPKRGWLVHPLGVLLWGPQPLAWGSSPMGNSQVGSWETKHDPLSYLSNQRLRSKSFFFWTSSSIQRPPFFLLHIMSLFFFVPTQMTSCQSMLMATPWGSQ